MSKKTILILSALMLVSSAGLAASVIITTRKTRKAIKEDIQNWDKTVEVMSEALEKIEMINKGINKKKGPSLEKQDVETDRQAVSEEKEKTEKKK